MKLGVGIKIDKKDRKILNKKNRELLSLLKMRMIDSGFFSEDGVVWVLKKIKKFDFFVMHPRSIRKILLYEPFVPSELLKVNNIDLRLKIGTDFFQCLSEEGKKQRNPYDSFNNILISVSGHVQRKYTLKRYKEAGVPNVKISCANDQRDCQNVKKIKNNIWDINNAPELPLDGCTAEYCRCVYIPVL